MTDDTPDPIITDHLTEDAVAVAYLDAALASGSAAYAAHALGQVARARGMTRIARDAGLSRGSLYGALDAKGNPSLATVMEVMRALGFRLGAVGVD